MRFLERIFSVNETCRMHDKTIPEFLTDILAAQSAGTPMPRLLPTR